MHRNAAIAAVAAGLAVVALTRSAKKASKPSSPASPGAPGDAVAKKPKKNSVKVDGVFLRRLRTLLRICVPGLFTRESALFVALTALLLFRTRLTITMANIVGSNAKLLVQRDARKFFIGVIDIGLWSLPSAIVNSGIRYVTALLQARFRNNLQRLEHASYLRDSAVYKVASGSKVDNPDHRLTSDINAFCTELAEIFPQSFKPTVDSVIFIIQLARNGGVIPPFLMVAYYFVAGSVLRALMPNFAKLTAQTAQREGDFRAVHSQIIQHAEEVAFYRGERTERHNADKYIASLVKHSLNVKQLKSYTDFMDGLLIKYGATCVGYAVCSIGVFALEGASAAERTRVYIRSSQLYIPLAQAIGKLVLLHNRITALAGYTSRVAELGEVLDDIHRTAKTANKSIIEVRASDVIAFKGVTVASPDGEALIKELDLTVERNQPILIMGNNGSGKTALLRALVGLWPVAAGTITRPELSDFTFVPQRTYLPRGNLREQLIFPDTAADAQRRGFNDDRLWELIDAVDLRGVVQREGGLDAFKEWHEVLSGGERQRIAFTRVLYHRPAFAVLDEATSAVSQDIEPAMYEAARKCGTTLITVSHREALKKYHSRLIVLDGSGSAIISDL